METMSDMSYIIDTLYVLFAMTLVVFMYPGFAMLEAGIVRTKNVP
jgi:Amt family ammonium transporter